MKIGTRTMTANGNELDANFEYYAYIMPSIEREEQNNKRRRIKRNVLEYNSSKGKIK